VFRCSCSMGIAVRDRVRIVILVTRFSSSAKAKGVWTVNGKTFEGGCWRHLCYQGR